ncbi:hypothetical protein [Streptomyces sp. NPDC002889]|uniref:hypothetical protein n=1 Tax=Streptomyces sp. NPDC002889 TaxID=3364669 RepID=UPI00369F135A
MGKPVLGTGVVLVLSALVTGGVMLTSGSGSAAGKPAAPTADAELGGRPNLIVPTVPPSDASSSGTASSTPEPERTRKPAPPAPRVKPSLTPTASPSPTVGKLPAPSLSLPPTGTLVPGGPLPGDDCHDGGGGGGRGGGWGGGYGGGWGGAGDHNC